MMETIKKELVRVDARGWHVWSETTWMPFITVGPMNENMTPDTEAPIDEGMSEIIEALESASGQITTSEVARSLDGGYIGDVEFAEMLFEKFGIVPELMDDKHEVCSIGFSERDQKWYGWSHRALYGFGVGSAVKRGDCAYQPTDEEDFRQDIRRFWDDDYHEQTIAYITVKDGVRGCRVSWKYNDTVPNESLRGTTNDSHFHALPKEFGPGEWTAMTLDDAKLMAKAFAESVG